MHFQELCKRISLFSYLYLYLSLSITPLCSFSLFLSLSFSFLSYSVFRQCYLFFLFISYISIFIYSTQHFISGTYSLSLLSSFLKKWYFEWPFQNHKTQCLSKVSMHKFQNIFSKKICIYILYMCLFGLQASNKIIIKLAASPLASRGFAPRGDQQKIWANS